MRQFIRFPKQCSTVLVVALGLLIQASLLWSQTKGTEGNTADSSHGIQTFPEPDPDSDRAAIDAHKKVLRAELAINSSTTVKFYEQPTSETVYGSSIEIERGGVSRATYRIGRIIGDQALRLVHTALIRFGDKGMLVCEYEGGAIGAREGFAILRFSGNSFELHTLPLTDFGKVVVFRGDPGRVEIWSALDEGVGPNAGERPYVTKTCRRYAKGYACSLPKHQRGKFVPGDIDDPGIEIRP